MSDTTVAAPAVAESTPTPVAPVESAALATPAPVAAPVEAAKPVDAKPVEAAKPAEAKPVEITGPYADKFKAFAKEAGIADAQQAKLAEFYGAIQAESAKAADAEWAKMDAGFREQLAADPVIGGLNLQASIEMARKGVEWAGGAELSRIFESTGLANHPALVKAFHKLGKSLSEDSVSGTSSQGAAPSSESHLADLYPSMFPQH